MCHRARAFYVLPSMTKAAFRSNRLSGARHEPGHNGYGECVCDAHTALLWTPAVTSWFSYWLALSVCFFFVIQKLFVIITFSRHIVEQMVSLIGWVTLSGRKRVCVCVRACLLTKSTMWDVQAMAHERVNAGLDGWGTFWVVMWHSGNFCPFVWILPVPLCDYEEGHAESEVALN